VREVLPSHPEVRSVVHLQVKCRHVLLAANAMTDGNARKLLEPPGTDWGAAGAATGASPHRGACRGWHWRHSLLVTRRRCGPEVGGT
jgi:hypothetical protein